MQLVYVTFNGWNYFQVLQPAVQDNKRPSVPNVSEQGELTELALSE